MTFVTQAFFGAINFVFTPMGALTIFMYLMMGCVLGVEKSKVFAHKSWWPTLEGALILGIILVMAGIVLTVAPVDHQKSSRTLIEVALTPKMGILLVIIFMVTALGDMVGRHLPRLLSK